MKRILLVLLLLQQTLAAQTTSSPCDLNGDGAINIADVQLSVNQVLGFQTCTMNLSGTGTCTVADVQKIIVAALGGSCAATPPPAPQIVMPIEVVGPAGTTESVSVSIPASANLAAPQKLWMQIHGLRYADKASVQVNNMAWVPIDDQTVTLLGQSKVFGGIGGGFSTHKMTLDLPAGTLVTGTNTVRFRFNATGGGLGFRVLGFNFQEPDGTMLLPASLFVQDDPNTWQPPLTDPADIAAGKQWFQTASILHAGKPVNAHCNDCHTHDGRDLHYFNYSSKFLHYGALISGLTSQQADQLVSYIRTLNYPNPGRPWNPPYQPAPGMDSKPLSDWAAGAGLDAVLDRDSDMLPYLMPSGSTANWAQSGDLNPRETPVSFQLPDWNHWLPMINPIDSFGSAFTNSAMNQLYLSLRSQLQPNNAAVYANVAGPNGPWQYWLYDRAQFMGPLTPPTSDPSWNSATFVQQIQSVNLWSVIKNWELNHEFGVEGMGQVIFGAKAPVRAWASNMPFRVGPGISGIPRPSPGIGNGTAMVHIYDSVAWYELQLILNEGYGGSIDWPYQMGYPTNDLTWNPDTGSPRVGTAGLLTLWLVSGLQHDDLNDAQSPKQLVSFPGQVSWASELSVAQKQQIMNNYLAVWYSYFGSMTPSQFQALNLWQNGNGTFTLDPHQNAFGNDLIYALPQLRFAGADPTLLNHIALWASTVWPSYNWINALNTSCTTGNMGQVFCATN